MSQKSESMISRIHQLIPKGSGALFFIQMFSTLSFSVLYSTLVLYTTRALHFNDDLATSITAGFVAFNFVLHLLGGYLGGRFLSYRFLFCLGMVLQALGCAFISIPSGPSLYWGLALFLTGCGLNVTCINCMLTQLFDPQDKRRETAFLWNYSGMNIGFLMGFTVSGFLQLQQSYHTLFILSAWANILALIVAALNWKKLADRHTSLSTSIVSKRRILLVLGLMIIVLLVPVLRFLLKNAIFANNLIMVVGVVMAITIFILALQRDDIKARKKMFAYMMFGVAALIFWSLYQLAPLGLVLFIERNVDRHFWGVVIPPQWVQNINTLVIIIGGPLLTILFKRLRDKGVKITIPLQFSLSLLLIGAGFAVLPLGIADANAQGFVSFYWIVISYLLQSAGELFIGPIGYAMVGQLAPKRLQGVMMGTWLMVSGVAATLSNYFSKIALGADKARDPLLTNPGFSHTFLMLGIAALIGGFLLLLMLRFLNNLIADKRAITAI